MIEKVSGVLPFSCEQMFDLAADIERYPEFLTGWISARIQKRESNICYVDQVVGLGPVRLQFTSKAVFHRPQRIEVTSTEAPFRQFRLAWLVAAVPSAGCRVSVAADIVLQSDIMQHIVRRILPTAVEDIVTAFEARARRLYARPAG
jgi:coenzyme Q-binding protein COQ10